MFSRGFPVVAREEEAAAGSTPDNRVALASYSWLSYPEMHIDLTLPRPKMPGALSHVSSKLHQAWEECEHAQGAFDITSRLSCTSRIHWQKGMLGEACIVSSHFP